jgi:hypothetical protein
MGEPSIDAGLKTLLCPLTKEERAALEEKLKAQGCLDKLKVWAEKNILLDGHYRLEICKANGIPTRSKPSACRVCLLRRSGC